MRQRIGLSAALVVSLSAAICVAPQCQDMAWGSVEYKRPILSVRLTQPTDLRTVLEAACRASESRCDVAASTAEVVLPALTLTGTWGEVVAQLLEGTGHNYAALAPSNGQQGRLSVAPRPPAESSDQKLREKNTRSETERDEPVSTPQGRAPDRRSSDDGQRAQRDTERDSESSSEAEGASSGSPGFSGTNQGGLASDEAVGVEQRRTTEQSLKTLYEGLTAPRPAQPPSGVAVLPFPGPDGQPITVPITNQPITVLPWPGPDGRPILVTPTPGVPLQWPIPATPGSSSPPK